MIKRWVKTVWRQPWVWRQVVARMRPAGVAVLTYHRVAKHPVFGGPGADVFDAQMRWLSEFCRPIAAAELIRAVDTAAGQARPPVLVTFDDGYRDFHEVARPILKRHCIPVLLFLPTALIGSEQLLWTDEVTWLVSSAAVERLSLPFLGGLDLPLADGAARAVAAARLKAQLKGLAEAERREILARVRHECQPQGAPPGRQMMTWDEVRSCRDVASIGGHSHTHPILSRIDDRQLDEEIGRCRERIEGELGERPEFFAYPNGRSADFDQRCRRALRAAGFRTAFTTEPGWCDGGDWLAVPRLPTYAASLSDFAWLLTHPPAA